MVLPDVVWSLYSCNPVDSRGSRAWPVPVAAVYDRCPALTGRRYN